MSTLDPAGPAAANIATLWWIMFLHKALDAHLGPMNAARAGPAALAYLGRRQPHVLGKRFMVRRWSSSPSAACWRC
jgi:hypothetical protein